MGVPGGCVLPGQAGGYRLIGLSARQGEPMSEPQRTADRFCFACGPDNPIGLKIDFRLEGERCVASFTPGENHVGYDGVVHGGIVFAALDDVMANWLYLQGLTGFTARCEIRYRRAVEPGETLELAGELVERRRRMARLRATARIAGDGEPVAEAEAAFMLADR